MRRAELLLAAGGDPRRELELDGRAVTSVADDLDEPDGARPARGLARPPRRRLGGVGGGERRACATARAAGPRVAVLRLCAARGGDRRRTDPRARTSSRASGPARAGSARRRERLPIDTDEDRLAQADRRGERATDEPAERNHAPDDEPPRRVRASEHPVRRDRLDQADRGDVEEDDAEADHQAARDQERNREVLGRQRRSGACRDRTAPAQRRSSCRRRSGR